MSGLPLNGLSAAAVARVVMPSDNADLFGMDSWRMTEMIGSSFYHWVGWAVDHFRRWVQAEKRLACIGGRSWMGCLDS